MMLALVALSGCSAPATSNDTAASASTQAESKGTGFNAADACAILPGDKVSAAFGEVVSGAELGMVAPGTAETAAFSQCTYRFASGAMVTFFARQSPVPDNTTEAMQRTKDALVDNLGATIEPVPGLGKDAFWTDQMNQLHVFIGEDRYIFFTSMKPPAGSKPREAMMTLAKSLAG